MGKYLHILIATVVALFISTGSLAGESLLIELAIDQEQSYQLNDVTIEKVVKQVDKVTVFTTVTIDTTLKQLAPDKQHARAAVFRQSLTVNHKTEFINQSFTLELDYSYMSDKLEVIPISTS